MPTYRGIECSPALAVEIEILAGVKNVEASHPERHRSGEQQDARIERAPHRNPRRCGRNAERESQHQMRPARNALRVGVKQQHRQRHGRQQQREAIQLARGKNEDARWKPLQTWRQRQEKDVRRAKRGCWCAGLAASMAASAQRLKAMAAERAATMATTIHSIWCSEGNPPAASMAPHSANGSAKMECSHLIISSVTRRLRRTGTMSIVMQGSGLWVSCVVSES